MSNPDRAPAARQRESERDPDRINRGRVINRRRDDVGNRRLRFAELEQQEWLKVALLRGYDQTLI